jgi:hypothetical protein
MVMVGRAAAHPDSLIYRSQSVRSIGVGFPSINYSLLSPLNHSGYSLGSHSTRFRKKPNSLTQFQLHFELGLLYNNANDSYITTLGFNSSWSRHWYVTDRSRPLRLMLGGAADVGVNIYLKEDNTNNPLAYFFNLSVSPSILVQYRFNIHKTKFELGQQIEAPAGSLISSSGYSSVLPPGFAEKDADFFDAMRTVSFGSLKKCVAVTSLDITPSLERRRQWPTFRVSYMFSGMNYRNGDFTVKSVDHIILFGAIFYLFR